VKLKEIIIVEGKDDVSAVKKAVDAQIIITQGLGFPKGTKEKIINAYKKCGIIVLTDPDYAGEKIRKKIEKIAPNCKHAYISMEEGRLEDNIGVENASVEAIQRALSRLHIANYDNQKKYSMNDMIRWGLCYKDDAKEKRISLGNCLGIGYGNTKQFLDRLNHYGIEAEEIKKCLDEVEKFDEQ
jgi:ribonuclease M5